MQSIQKKISIHRFTNILVSMLTLIILLYITQDLLIPIFTSALLSLAIYPIINRLESLNFPPLLALITTLFSALVLVILIFALAAVQINNFIQEIPTLVKLIEHSLLQVQAWIEHRFSIDTAAQLTWLRDNMMQFITTGTSIVRTTITATSNLMFYLALIPIYMFLMIYYRSNVKSFMLEVSPKENMELTLDLIKEVQDVIQNYVNGLFIVIGIVAIFYSIGLLIIDIKYAVFFGCISALLTIIPYFGAYFGALITFSYVLLTTQSWQDPVAVLLVYGTVQFFEGNFITPYVIGNKVQLNALVVIISLLAGGYLWGTWGLILSVPLVAILKIVFDNISDLKPYGRLMGTRRYKH